MEPDVITVDHWDAPEENDVRILTAPNQPYPIHLLAPRTLLGNTVWNMMRRHCYEQADDTCEVCGYCPENKRARHSHELMSTDYATQTVTFERCICLCAQCVDEDTEVLTESGWKKIPTVTTEDKVACFNAADETICFDNPTETIVQKHNKAIKVSGNGANLIFSDKHRLALRVKSNRSSFSGKIVDVLAENYTDTHYYNWVLSGNNNKEEHLTDEERVYIAIEADGHLQWDKEDPKGGERSRAYNTRFGSENFRYTYYVSLAKKRKIDRLKQLLLSSGMKYKIIKETSDNYCEFNIWSNKELKHFKNCFNINMGHEKALEFIEELVFWDGSYCGESAKWYTNKPEEIDFVQAVACQCSIRTTSKVVNRIGNIRKGKWNTPYERLTYALSFLSVRNEFTGRSMVPEEIEWNKNLYCITVPTSYFVARKDSLVFITGNCHLQCIHTGRALTMYKKDSPLMTKEMLLEGAEHAYSLISKWNKEHPDEEPLRLFSAWLDYEKIPELRDKMVELRTKYDIKFYRVSEKWYKDKYWKNWKLVIGNRSYHTPYENKEDWARVMEENNNKRKPEFESPFKGGVYDELDKFLKEE